MINHSGNRQKTKYKKLNSRLKQKDKKVVVSIKESQNPLFAHCFHKIYTCSGKTIFCFVKVELLSTAILQTNQWYHTLKQVILLNNYAGK